ncbi:MAG: aminotransferase class I/II-fold pyridoxal phosphate-dependent enzyme [Lachnospiraceae bacterium]|jgi:aspartate/methionine/tyrosine aminotransferase|nr:aminotransferase class I/II-fold pyridoxal phosphate-dependent enzyme [Lachnospiraceae bacterium]
MMMEKNVKPYGQLSAAELSALCGGLQTEFEGWKGKALKLDMSRGKPGKGQLDLSMGMLDTVGSGGPVASEDGTDTRNYGVLDGIPEAKGLFAGMLGVPEAQVIVFGSSSLNVMYDTVARSFTHGVMGAEPWYLQAARTKDPIKFLCPAPGYDRHFAITEHFGIGMVNIPMTDEGPDMDMVERLVNSDEGVKGIWCVPKYSNPLGTSYSDETVRRFAALRPAAKDFRIYWDNAYCVHHLYPEADRQDSVLDIIEACAKAGNPDLVYEFASTSKLTFPGAGVAAMAASPANIADVKNHMKYQTIGNDKVNQLRQAKFLGDPENLAAHMQKHAAIIRPKFEAVLDALETQLGGLGIARWTKPRGGYFISFEGLPGTAKAIVARCKEAGVVMTGAGATYPYGKDPDDSNIRIAPTFPSLGEITQAAQLFALCVKLVSAEKLLGERG